MTRFYSAENAQSVIFLQMKVFSVLVYIINQTGEKKKKKNQGHLGEYEKEHIVFS